MAVPRPARCSSGRIPLRLSSCRLSPWLAAFLTAGVLACAGQEPREGQPVPADAAPNGPSDSTAATGPSHLRISGTRFVRSDGTTFHWRGITAFRLLELIARDNGEAEAERYLDWAAAQELTVVRVLGMARHLFDLAPEAGLAAAPRLLRLAEARGLHVEFVALADTAERRFDVDAHFARLAEIAASHPNILVEIANEPTHATQAPEVHDPAWLAARARAMPESVPVALGSVERGEGFAAGDYVTWHVPREPGAEGWQHVVEVAAGAGFVARWGKPVVSDEPIGAAGAFQPGRRDDSPARFRAAALLTRLAGMGATFHYEGGLHARIPEGRELETFRAWNEAWTLLPDDAEDRGRFYVAGEGGAAVRGFSDARALRVFERHDGATASILLVGVRGAPEIQWSDGWIAGEVRRLDGSWLITARFQAARP